MSIATYLKSNIPPKNNTDTTLCFSSVAPTGVLPGHVGDECVVLNSFVTPTSCTLYVCTVAGSPGTWAQAAN